MFARRPVSWWDQTAPFLRLCAAMLCETGPSPTSSSDGLAGPNAMIQMMLSTFAQQSVSDHRGAPTVLDHVKRALAGSAVLIPYCQDTTAIHFFANELGCHVVAIDADEQALRRVISAQFGDRVLHEAAFDNACGVFPRGQALRFDLPPKNPTEGRVTLWVADPLLMMNSTGSGLMTPNSFDFVMDALCEEINRADSTIRDRYATGLRSVVTQSTTHGATTNCAIFAGQIPEAELDPGTPRTMCMIISCVLSEPSTKGGHQHVSLTEKCNATDTPPAEGSEFSIDDGSIKTALVCNNRDNAVQETWHHISSHVHSSGRIRNLVFSQTQLQRPLVPAGTR